MTIGTFLRIIIQLMTLSGKTHSTHFISIDQNRNESNRPLFSNLNLTITIAPIQLWKWQMFISQNLRQSWYGNMFGDDRNDEDQDTIKVKKHNSDYLK